MTPKKHAWEAGWQLNLAELINSLFQMEMVAPGFWLPWLPWLLPSLSTNYYLAGSPSPTPISTVLVYGKVQRAAVHCLTSSVV